jgi:hypothetical protein
MVGFGSSLRMARRIGWEQAYLDYETLKMLLSQIEAVYEEEGHRQRSSNVEGDTVQDANDYRDELFLESDSDLAYASSNGEEEIANLLSSDDEPPINQFATASRPFSLDYSRDVDSDSESVDLNSNCGSASFVSLGWKSTGPIQRPTEKKRKKKKRSIRSSLTKEDSDYFVNGGVNAYNSGPKNFILQNPEGSLVDTIPSSLLHRNVSNESSFIYSGSHKVSDAGAVPYPSTPAQEKYENYHSSWPTPLFEHSLMMPIIEQPNSVARRPNTREEIIEEKKDEKRRHQRRQRRRWLTEKQRQRDKRVPPHLRIAHAKARAITERFLGLLRAEVEKVTLFTQSRFGELADTAGSLRFPYFDDNHFLGVSNAERNNSRTPTFDNPLIDGGRHPSASSSDDEDTGRRGNGAFPWFDSSDDDEESLDTSRPGNRSPGFMSPIAKTQSGGTLSTEHRSNLSARENAKHGRNDRRIGDSTKSYAVAQRQISNFTDIRLSRPLFQRMDHIVGEDLLLLSAVDEADGYTALGVELMHLLRFICVNVIAVRKICRKHDRLLMNRMLGGYYVRKQRLYQLQLEGNRDKASHSFTLGGLFSHSLVHSTERKAQMSQNKLTGHYDIEIQKLANSKTVQAISSSIAFSLSEYEISHSRADALANLNSTSAIKKVPLQEGRNENKESWAFGLSPSRWSKGTNNGVSKSSIHRPSPIAETMSSDGSEPDKGPPTTMSMISLTRLRFTVVSIFALRELARHKQDQYDVFVSRSSLIFSGANVIGEGLDGCSRDTLDFFVHYSPDAALLLDSITLYEAMKKNGWKEIPISTIMRSALEMGIIRIGGNRDDFSSPGDLVSAVSLNPKSNDEDNEKKWRSYTNDSIHDAGIHPLVLQINRIGIFLSSVRILDLLIALMCPITHTSTDKLLRFTLNSHIVYATSRV